MTINTRRMFALLLAVFLALSLFPGAAFAAEDGTSTEPETTEPEESTTDPPLEERPIEEIWAELEAALPEAYYDESNPDDPYSRGIPQDNFFPEEFYMDPASFPSLFTTESDFPAEMWDNDVLDSLQYIGYDVAYLKSINRLYDYNYMASRLLTNAPEALSDVGYSGAVWVNGDGTVEDSTTVTGYAPNVARFEKYWVNDPTPTKTVTVKAGETAKVTFQNQWRGQAQIIKTATNGGSVAGWHFEVKDSNGTVVGNYLTDATGIITLDLEPGVYTVTETDGAYQYWVNDPTPTKTVTVKAGETAKVTFTNQWRGQVQIIKTATNGGSVAGWHFEVKDSTGTVVGNYVTDSTGIITLDLEPGTYTVTETDGKYEYWHNDPTPVKTVTVKAGETAKVTFQNQWVGKAKIVKTATNGGTVEGWEFTITDARLGNSAEESERILKEVKSCISILCLMMLLLHTEKCWRGIILPNSWVSCAIFRCLRMVLLTRWRCRNWRSVPSLKSYKTVLTAVCRSS